MEKNNDPYNRKEVYPNKGFDYLILKYKGVDPTTCMNDYSGEMHVKENQLQEFFNHID